MTTTEIITEQMDLINQMDVLIVNQRNQIECLQKTADSSVLTINKMSRIIGEQVERINQLKARVKELEQNQFIKSEN